MTTNQKILIALGLGAVAFYVYKMRGQKGQGVVTQPQDNKGQNIPTSIEKPQVSNKPLVNDTRVVDEGKNPIRRDKYGMPQVGVNTPEQDQKIIEQIVLFEALKQKYGNIRGGNVGDKLTTKYGTYEYRRIPTGGALGKGFTTTWVKI
jgi:hypothetical protein